MTKLIVIAKAPVAGRVKTRLCPPCSPEQAAAIAEAALRDTLDVVTSVPGAEPVIALDGAAGNWLPDGVDVVQQRGDGLASRLDAAFADVGTPAVLIGMDTPQITVGLLAYAIDAITDDGNDCVLGSAVDGGWWAIGFRHPQRGAFDGVPMSTAHTGRAQRERLRAMGVRVAELPILRDVDTMASAIAVAEQVPHRRFAEAVREVVTEHDRAGAAVDG